MNTFTITEDHMKLLRHAYVTGEYVKSREYDDTSWRKL